MLQSRIARSNRIGIVLGALAVLIASVKAQPATNDCERLDVATVASILSVPKARANPSRGHTKQQPDNMDVLGCSWVEASPNPLAKVLMFNMFTPLPKNLASMFASLSHPNVFGPPPQPFSPGVGLESTGWVRPSVNGETFDGSIVFRMSSYIMDIKVSGMPSLDATKKALVNAGKALAKP